MKNEERLYFSVQTNNSVVDICHSFGFPQSVQSQLMEWK